MLGSDFYKLGYVISNRDDDNLNITMLMYTAGKHMGNKQLHGNKTGDTTFFTL
jgi:hypothetical protein